MYSIGFTGTQSGITEGQFINLSRILHILSRKGKVEVHHGMCIGADHEFHIMIRSILGSEAEIHGHPCNIYDKQAKIIDIDVMHPIMKPLKRNKIIAKSSDQIIVCPKESEEQLRSGTWATYRYAQQANKEITLIKPDGTVCNSI
jgi:hypothetical protein